MQNKAEQVVLVGIPGSGKSTVGRLLAGRLDWRFVDIDDVIESETGLTIARIFDEQGEPEFRRRESELTGRLASELQIVVAPGAGWIMRNRMPDALVVWLQTTPVEAIRRLGDRVKHRPLLQPDPLKKMAGLLAERLQYYGQAHIQIDTDGMTADAVASAVAVAIEHYGNQEKR